MLAGSVLHAASEAMRLADVDPIRAIPLAAQVVRNSRDDVPALALAEQAWGHALCQTGQIGEAVTHLRRAVRLGTGKAAAESRMKLAFALVQQGRPTSALREVDLAVPLLGARARSQRAVILYHLGRLDDAFADYQAADRALRRGGEKLAVQRNLVNRGIVQAERQNFGLAVRDLVEAEGLARDLGRDLAVGIIAENLGFVESRRGDVPAALAHFDRAEEIIARNGGRLAPVLFDRAELLLSVGLAGEAREHASQAVTAFRTEGRRLMVPETLLLLADAALLGRDWAAAGRHARAALAQFVRQGRDQHAAFARATVLRAALSAGKPCRISDPDAMVAALHGRPAVQAHLDLAVVARRRRQPARAVAHLTTASQARTRGPATLRARGWYAEALLHEHTAPQRAAAAARRGLRILDENHAALGAGDLRAHSATHRADLAELGLRVALRSGRLADVFEWAERGRASRFLHRPVRPPDDPELAALLQSLRATKLTHRQVELERRIKNRSRLLRATGPGPSEPVRPAELDLGGRVLVQYVEADGDLLALTLTDRRLDLRVVGPVREVADLLERVPFALRHLARRPRPEILQLLRTTTSTLDSLLLPRCDRPLVVVPTGLLHNVPWSTLPSCRGKPVVVAPSATSWRSAASRPARPRTFAVASGPGLPGAEEEAQAIADLHATTNPRDATVDDVLKALATASTVHLAAHGRLNPDNPLFSALDLHDGPLVVYDVQRLEQVPDTVIMAACDVGRSVVVSGNELLGLAATFLERGTAQLIAPVVPVPDAETKDLMLGVHRRLRDGRSPAAALAEAQEELGRPNGFVCVGA
ncbi:CHAT domain-containing tetratricopeptide repeat protein [Lentzea sp. BCCO 10_0061]|uniref:CHAT domain-containing tetratricopeptide repeat protein n=1 Tax=Lentzea sokolovensis TaxID=3095429 RepID=A0ABU4URN1_9PSEU|nr:CHAT domain-containing tetratricopeptide repeat protein [Lentzea sp. BCCO 10_0061]MDX8142150.1 CHAT domain-containing tetratricopeptide repeat protein [Lentzea sp. BCCO 10_0061]